MARAISFNVDGMIAMLLVGTAVERGTTDEFSVAPNIFQKVDGVVCAGEKETAAGVGAGVGVRNKVLAVKPMIINSNPTLEAM
jgi:hypothetical protein